MPDVLRRQSLLAIGKNQLQDETKLCGKHHKRQVLHWPDFLEESLHVAQIHQLVQLIKHLLSLKIKVSPIAYSY